MLREPAYKHIDYYFSVLSPWAYMGHEWFLATARNLRLPVHYKPFNLIEIFGETGGLPLAKRHNTRQNYRFIELQRWQMQRGIEMNLKPKFFPFDASLADRAIIAALQTPKFNPGMFILKLMRGAFCEERDMSTANEVARIAAIAGLEADAIIKLAKSDKITAIYQNNTAEAVKKGVFGSPTYDAGGELYWGQDRIEMMQQAIEEDRSPYKAPQ